MPFKYRAVGRSPNDVRNTETVTVHFRPDYPWSAPRFYLRDDFDRQLPHIQPGRKSRPPEPCLVDGLLDEYFYEAGLLALVEQLCDWLEKAAKQQLINRTQGWEPTLRHQLLDEFVADAEHLRSFADSRGGARVFKTVYLRYGEASDYLGGDAQIYGQIERASIRLHRLKGQKPLSAEEIEDKTTAGNSVAIVVWQGTHGGLPMVSDTYHPETVETMADLIDRAKSLRCEGHLLEQLARLDSVVNSTAPAWPVPVLVIFCVRRPFHIIGSTSSIELVPYAFDVRGSASTQSITEQAELEVVPIAQRDVISKQLLQEASGVAAPALTSILGCGSVGSKFALHLARSGGGIAAVIDSSRMQPHNMARHGLITESIGGKSSALAAALKVLDQKPAKLDENIVTALSDASKCRKLAPDGTCFAIDSTASLRVRSKLSDVTVEDFNARIVSTALFAQGRGAYLMIEGNDRCPTIDDVTVEYYRHFTEDALLRSIAIANDGALEHVATGQGCGSLTMRMTDARVSAMTAGLVEQFVGRHDQVGNCGELIVGLHDDECQITTWSRVDVEQPIIVDFEGNPDWSFRIQPHVLEKIQQDISTYQTVETGGVLMGRANDRLRTISVVDVLPAPPDSKRSAAGFLLGVEGLEKAIKRYHTLSGGTLYDVGTWHSHLANQGPSPTDEATAEKLAGTRPPPFGLLIVAPSTLYGVMHMDE